MNHIDFRSDTVTQPTAGMLDAMFSAKVGDDVFNEDPTVKALEEKLAKLFGMEAALFFPSGTMSNQVAIKCFTQPMDEVICDQTAHVYRYEGGGIAYNSMASVRLLNGNRGIITPEMIAAEVNEDNIHYPTSSLVVIENTVNKGGGKCYQLEEVQAIHKICATHQLKLHLDGARLFNALVATGTSPAQYGQCFDGISVCLSKGLGAPVGSVLIANQATIDKALRIRKVFGGGMRQAGFLAAAGIYALDHHIDRLKVDHEHAEALANALAAASFVHSVMPVETNIILFEVKPNLDSATVVKGLAAKGILCNATSKQTIRFVTHLNISATQIDQTITTLLHLHF